MNNVPLREAEPAECGRAENSQQLESGVRSYSGLINRVFSQACGPYLFDEHGQRFVDFLCGAGVLNYGHNNPHIKRVLLY